MLRSFDRFLAVLACLFGLAACGGGNDPGRSGEPSGCERVSTASAAPRVSKVVLVVFENTDTETVLRQPYFSDFAARGARLAGYVSLAHPSQPNYIALVAGGTLGVTTSEPVRLEARHLGDLLEESGKSWKSYAQGFPGGCSLVEEQGAYVRRHVPFLSFANVQDAPARCARVRPLEDFAKDLTNDALPDFSFVVADNEHNGHDGTIVEADEWFRTAIGEPLARAGFLRDGWVIAVFDEPTGANAGFGVYAAIAGAGVRPGSVVNECFSHYDLLRTVEEGLGLGSLGRRDGATISFQGVWNDQP